MEFMAPSAAEHPDATQKRKDFRDKRAVEPLAAHRRHRSGRQAD